MAATHTQSLTLPFQLASPVASDRFDSLAKTNFSVARIFVIISIITSSQVNVSLCSLQYALNELISTKISQPWFSQSCHQISKLVPVEKHSFLSNYRFMIFTNKIIIWTCNLTLNVANIGIDVIIIGVTQQIQSFYFLTNSHRASQLVAKNHSAETTSQKGIFTSLWLVGYHSS